MNTFTSFLLILILHVLLREILCNPTYPEKNILCSDDNERYNEESQSCQKLGEQGTCGERMIFLADDDENSMRAECECDFFNNLEPLVYHEATTRCYSIFTQAYCEDGYWLVPEGRPPNVQFRCKENKCLDVDHSINFKELQHPYIVLYRGNCTMILSEGMCPTDQVVTFNHDHPFPGCGPRPDTENILPHGIAPKRLRCRPGSRRIITGKCVPSYHIPSAKPSV